MLREHPLRQNGPPRHWRPGSCDLNLALSLLATSHESICLAAGPTHPTPATSIGIPMMATASHKCVVTKLAFSDFIGVVH
ncbi:hypothetical protein STEG23_037014 [Scotinomys teguina]